MEAIGAVRRHLPTSSRPSNHERGIDKGLFQSSKDTIIPTIPSRGENLSFNVISIFNKRGYVANSKRHSQLVDFALYAKFRQNVVLHLQLLQIRSSHLAGGILLVSSKRLMLSSQTK